MWTAKDKTITGKILIGVGCLFLILSVALTYGLYTTERLYSEQTHLVWYRMTSPTIELEKTTGNIIGVSLLVIGACSILIGKKQTRNQSSVICA